MAEDGQVVGVSDQHRAARRRHGSIAADVLVADTGGVLHPVQGHVQQAWADHPALRSPLPGRGEPAVFGHACSQPPGDQFPGWEGAELAEEMIVADPVKRRRQVRIEHPGPARGGTAAAFAHLEDGLDRVMAATARPEPIRLRLEPRFPLWFQCISRHGLQRPVGDHGDG
jgi:hypothetical protein